MIRILFSLVIFLHGLIHMLGFVKEWNLAEVKLSGVFISFPGVFIQNCRDTLVGRMFAFHSFCNSLFALGRTGGGWLQ